MQTSIGAHIIKTAYGQWLPGDPRGHWSAAWNPEQGHHNPHQLNPGDPIRQKQAADRMNHPPTIWSTPIRQTIAETIQACANQSDWSTAALAVEPTHFHLAVTPSPTKLDSTCKWLAQEVTKAIRAEHNHPNPTFAKGKWAAVITEDTHWHNALNYINRHPHAIQLESRQQSRR